MYSEAIFRGRRALETGGAPDPVLAAVLADAVVKDTRAADMTGARRLLPQLRTLLGLYTAAQPGAAQHWQTALYVERKCGGPAEAAPLLLGHLAALRASTPRARSGLGSPPREPSRSLPAGAPRPSGPRTRPRSTRSPRRRRSWWRRGSTPGASPASSRGSGRRSTSWCTPPRSGSPRRPAPRGCGWCRRACAATSRTSTDLLARCKRDCATGAQTPRDVESGVSESALRRSCPAAARVSRRAGQAAHVRALDVADLVQTRPLEFTRPENGKCVPRCYYPRHIERHTSHRARHHADQLPRPARSRRSASVLPHCYYGSRPGEHG